MAQAMAQAGDKEGLNRILALAEKIREKNDKAHALSGVARAMAQAGEKENARRIAIRALDEAEAIEGKWSRPKASALSGVADAMAQAGDKEEAIKVAEKALAAAEAIEYEGDNASALSAVARAMAQAGAKEDAVKVANQALNCGRGAFSMTIGSKAVCYKRRGRGHSPGREQGRWCQSSKPGIGCGREDYLG